MELDGIFASRDKRLAMANLVYVPYCSSDAWVGSVAAAPPTHFAFRGRDIATAVVGDLVQHRGLGRFQGTRVLYGGCGTGALGALLNLDRVGALLQTLIVPSSNLRRFGGLLDSPLMVEEQPMAGAAQPSYMAQAQGVATISGAGASVSAACRAAHPQPSDAWRCLFASYALPFVRSDLFLNAFQYDAEQLAADTGAGVPNRTPAQRAYAEAYRNATRAIAFADVIDPAAQGNAAMLPACFQHCNTLGQGFSSMATDDFTLEQAVSAWFYGQAHVNDHDDELSSPPSPPPSSSSSSSLPSSPSSAAALAPTAARRLRGVAAARAAMAKAGLSWDPPKTVPQFIVEDCEGFNCGDSCPNSGRR